MSKEKRKAWINWSSKEYKWILRLWINDKWTFSKSWGVRSSGVDNLSGDSIDWVHDSIICEIAHLQELGYDVSVTC